MRVALLILCLGLMAGCARESGRDRMMLRVDSGGRTTTWQNPLRTLDAAWLKAQLRARDFPMRITHEATRTDGVETDRGGSRATRIDVRHEYLLELEPNPVLYRVTLEGPVELQRWDSGVEVTYMQTIAADRIATEINAAVANWLTPAP